MWNFLRSLFSLFVFVFVTGNVSYAQSNKGKKDLREGVVTYAFKNNGKEMSGRAPLKLYFKDNIAFLSSSPDQTALHYIDYNKEETCQVLKLKDGSRYTLKTPFSAYEKAVITEDTATILGYLCRKATMVIRSNSIEVWFTNQLPLKGTPGLEMAPGLGLILKTIRNGNFETYATNIELRKISDNEAELPVVFGQVVDEATYRRKEIDNRFITIPVFNQQQINFTDSIINPGWDQENVTYRYAGGTLVMKKIRLPEEGNYSVFAHLTQYSNGDAYDRTGSVFVVPVDRKISFLDAVNKGLKTLPVYKDKQGKEYQGVVATSDYLPPLELMRFFTPFGVRAYNDRVNIAGYKWADSVNYEQDITNLLPRLRGEVWIGVFIGNYDRGGHTVNLNLEFHPRGGGRARDVWIQPIFNTLNVLEMAGQTYATMFEDDSLTVTVDIPEGVKNFTLRYITTGHGGWGGGDEFNQKLNEIFVDGQRVFSFIPWRTDCGTYRMSNPSSGNFADGLSSSDLSRSNWCPGTTTNPVYIPLGHLPPGKHVIKVAIPLGKTEGTSFSSWNVSGCLIGEY